MFSRKQLGEDDFGVCNMCETPHAHGFTKAAWMRLPMAEKFAILRGER